MKKYDKDATCIKCGGEIEDVYRTERTQEMADFMTAIGGTQRNPPCMPRPERIQRTCKNCGYSWSEKPLDKVELPDMRGRFPGDDCDHAADAVVYSLGPEAELHICKTKETLDKLTERLEPKRDDIEVGDVVKCKSKLASPLCSYEVVAIDELRYELKPLYTLHSIEEQCTLVRKGPKVIDCGISHTDINDEMRLERKVPKGNYRITLTKEVTS